MPDPTETSAISVSAQDERARNPLPDTKSAGGKTRLEFTRLLNEPNPRPDDVEGPNGIGARIRKEFEDPTMDGHAKAAKNGDKESGNTLRQSFVNFIDAVFKKFKRNTPGPDRFAIDVSGGDLLQDKGKRAFFEALADPARELSDAVIADLRPMLLHFALPRNQMKIEPLSETPFELSIRALPEDTFKVVIDILLNNTEVIRNLGLTAEVQNKLKVLKPRSEDGREYLSDVEDAEMRKILADIQNKYTIFNRIPTDPKDRGEPDMDKLKHIAMVMEYFMNGPDGIIADMTQAQRGGRSTEELKEYIKQVVNTTINSVGVEAAQITRLEYLTAKWKTTLRYNRRLMEPNSERGVTEEMARQSVLFQEVPVFNRVFKMEGNVLQWNEEGANALDLDAKTWFNMLYKRADAQPTEQFDMLFEPLIEGMNLRYMESTFANLADSEKITQMLQDFVPDEVRRAQLQQQLRTKMEYLSRWARLFQRNKRLFQDAERILNNTPPEKWTFLDGYDISQFALMTEDPLVNLAVKKWTSLIQEDTVDNGGEIRSDLFGGKYKTMDDKGNTLLKSQHEYLYPIIETAVDHLRDMWVLAHPNDPVPSTDRLRMAVQIARGVNMTIFRTSAVLSVFKAKRNFKYEPMYQVLGLHRVDHRWEWDLGGREDLLKGSYFYAMEIALTELPGNFAQRWAKLITQPWVPKDVIDMGKKFYDEVEGMNAEQAIHVLREKMEHYREAVDSTNYWGNLRQKLGIGDWISRNGWSAEGMRAALEKDSGKSWIRDSDSARQDDWDEIYAWLLRGSDGLRSNPKNVKTDGLGVLSLFMASEERGVQEANQLLDLVFSGVDIHTIAGMTVDQIKAVRAKIDHAKKKKINEFKLTGKKFEDKILKNIRIGGSHGGDAHYADLTYREWLEHRQTGLRGMAFYDQLQRDPMNFLNNVSTLIKEIAEGEVTLSNDATINGRSYRAGDKVSAGEFYFDSEDRVQIDPRTGQPVPVADLKGPDQDKKRHFLYYIKNRFLGNNEEVRELMDFHTALYRSDVFGKDQKRARKALFKYLNAANELAVARNGTTILPSDFDFLNSAGASTLTPQERLEADFIRDLMFNGYRDPVDAAIHHNGLIRFFREHVGDDPNTGNDINARREYFGNGSDNMGHIDEFFNRLANTWYIRDCIAVAPNAEFNYNRMFEYANASGENSNARRVADMATFADVQSKVVDLYRKVKAAAMKGQGNWHEIFADNVLEIQKAIKQFDGVIDPHFSRQINYYVTYMVSRFFMVHGGVRAPHLFGVGKKLLLGENSSISRNGFGPHAFEFTSDGLIDYIHYLVLDSCLEKDGLWSGHMLERNLLVDNATYYTLEFLPNILITLLLLLIGEFTEKAAEEADKGMAAGAH